MAKLLIIGCSDKKNEGGRDLGTQRNDFFQNALQSFREVRDEQYSNKLYENPQYFNHGNGTNRPNYYRNAWEGDLYRKAIDRYSGIMYSSDLVDTYTSLINSGELHLLIISDLYGLLRHDDHIKDYHYNLNKMANGFASSHIRPALMDYIEQNQIEHENVGVALSETNYIGRIGKFHHSWNNLWVPAGGIAGLRTTAREVNNWL